MTKTHRWGLKTLETKIPHCGRQKKSHDIGTRSTRENGRVVYGPPELCYRLNLITPSKSRVEGTTFFRV